LNFDRVILAQLEYPVEAEDQEKMAPLVRKVKILFGQRSLLEAKQDGMASGKPGCNGNSHIYCA